MPSVYIVRGGPSYSNMFKGRGWTVVDNMEQADIVQFCGGADVDPAYYGEANHLRTVINRTSDLMDEEAFIAAMEMGLPVTGICRGGQFLNVMAGGSMYQDVDGHAGHPHKATDIKTGEIINVTSTHHQMMRPAVDSLRVAIATESTRRDYLEGMCTVHNYGKKHEDVEVVFYDSINALCFQPHPEMVSNGHPCQEYYFKLLDRFFKLA